MEFLLGQVAAVSGAQILDVSGNEMSNSDHLSGLCVRGWSIDSRTASQGDLFFAIKGERHDGHAFIGTAFERGAVAAVVSEPIASSEGPLLKVADTLDALQKAASWARRKWDRPIVAITGSAGKTSTKDIIAEFLGTRFRVGKTIGNLNNHLGLPLTILRIPADAEIGVVELGMNHSGEIRDLAKIAEPQIAVVTNVGYAHVEAFDSIEGVAAAKRELVESLPASGTAILNADDKRVLAFRHVHNGRTLTFGFSGAADIRATDVEMNAEGAEFTTCGTRFRTALTGRHAISNVLAGLAVAILFEIEPEQLLQKVAELRPGSMRGERSCWRGITILNDSYNSNPEAARNMVDVLVGEPAKRRIAVLGEMRELGHLSEELHRDLGSYVANAGVDVLIGVRGVSCLLVEQARRVGLSDHAAFFFEDPESAGKFLRDFVRTGDAILFKGSRGTHVETALATMKE